MELSSIGSEFVASRISTELVKYLKYKLQCLGIPLDVLSNIFCYNKSMVTNFSVTTSMLNKRHKDIFYHHML